MCTIIELVNIPNKAIKINIFLVTLTYPPSWTHCSNISPNNQTPNYRRYYSHWKMFAKSSKPFYTLCPEIERSDTIRSHLRISSTKKKEVICIAIRLNRSVQNFLIKAWTASQPLRAVRTLTNGSGGARCRWHCCFHSSASAPSTTDRTDPGL